MSSPTPHRDSPTRRTVVTAAAWSVPLVALAAAAPAASASGDTIAVATGSLQTADPDLLTFVIVISNVPSTPASSPGDFVGFLFDFCLPEGLRIDSVSPGEWNFFPYANIDGEPDYTSYEGGDSAVYNQVALTASRSAQVLVSIRKDPALTDGISGDLGADAVVSSTVLPDLEWHYSYGPGGVFHANCAK